MFKDYYKILEVGPDATPEMIQEQYRLLIQVWHPDKISGKSKLRAEERTKEINEAYSVLRDTVKRKEYHLIWANQQSEKVGNTGETRQFSFTSEYFEDDNLNYPVLWKKLAKWGKDTNLLTPKERKFVFKIGDIIGNRWEMSNRQKEWAIDLLRKALENGFISEREN